MGHTENVIITKNFFEFEGSKIKKFSRLHIATVK